MTIVSKVHIYKLELEGTYLECGRVLCGLIVILGTEEAVLAFDLIELFLGCALAVLQIVDHCVQ